MPDRSENATSNPPPAPRGVAWIDLQAASTRSGLTPQRLRQLCGEKWAAAGLAKQERPAGGGKPTWTIREDADGRLARVQFADDKPFDTSGVSDRHRRQAYERKAIIDGWSTALADAFARGETKEAATADYLNSLRVEKGRQLSADTLYLWERRFRRDGLAGLVDGRCRADRKVERSADPFIDDVLERYLNPNKPPLTACYDDASRLAKKTGWATHSYQTCNRAKLALPRDVVLRRRFGKKAENDKASSYLLRDYTTVESNGVWCGDHHQFDVIVRFPDGSDGRPWVTAWMDMRSRKIVGWHLFAHDPNQDTILQAFQCVRDAGVPFEVYIDNGKDYDAVALQGVTKAQRRKVRVGVDAVEVGGVFGELGVKVVHCQPYHGQSKPIERFFGTLENRFGKVWATYCGNKPENRPEDLARRVERGAGPTLADFTTAFGEWLASYHARPHDGHGMDGRSPDEVYAACLSQKRTATEAALRLLLQKKSTPVMVHRNGVTYLKNQYGRNHPALSARQRQKVRLRINPADMSSVSVWTLEGHFICHAPVVGRLPVNSTHEEVKAAVREQRRARKARAEYHRTRPRLTESVGDGMFHERAARRKAASATTPTEPPPPTTLLPIQTKLTEQDLRAYERTMPARRAAGAEGMTPDPLAYRTEFTPADDAAASSSWTTEYLAWRERNRAEDES
jgi:putative transposase